MDGSTRQLTLLFLWSSPLLLLILLVTAGCAWTSLTQIPATSPGGDDPAAPEVINFALTPHTTAHPSLFFDDIAECPGYKNNDRDPWRAIQATLLDAAEKALSWDFSREHMGNGYESIMDRGAAAKSLALAYQITKDGRYADGAKLALLNIGVGPVENNYRKSAGLMGYCIAYDWTQPTLSPAEDRLIRNDLAVLANEVYGDLNDNGTNRDYVTFHDYHGRAYVAVAMAGLVLHDFENPDGLSLSSGPDDWVKCGTESLWVRDPLHDFDRSLASWAIEASTGKDYVGYNAYTDEGLILFAQAYSHVYDRNYFEDYPLAKKHFLAEAWSSLPNDYSATFEAIGNVLWIYEPGILNLMDTDNRSYLLNRYDRVLKAKKLLQYPSVEGGASQSTVYLFMDDYTSVPRKFPPGTSRLDANAMFQVFRQSWEDDGEWLSLRTFYPMYIESNRVEPRQDQLGFEYYGKGDLLLADGGEEKYILDRGYATTENYHNTIAIEDPRNPFTLSTWSNSPARAIFKGLSGRGIVTPTRVQRIAETAWMELLSANVTIEEVVDKDWTKSVPLSSAIAYERTVLFPDKDYFVIVDRFEGREPWVYRDIFRPASLVITPTGDKNGNQKFDESDIGHVNGELAVGGDRYDWLSLRYKRETATGTNTSLIAWSTTNPYGRPVELQLYSVPASDILVTKHVGRIGGTGYEMEVYSPVVYFRHGAGESLYRVTVLLSRYRSDAQRVPGTVAVNGNGNALMVTGPGHVDYAYTGKGISTFGPYATDADTVFVRTSDGVSEYTLIHGTVLSTGGNPLVRTAKAVDYLTLRRDVNGVSIRANSSSAMDLRIDGLGAANDYRVIVDGSKEIVGSLTGAGTGMTIGLLPGEHAYEIRSR